MGGESMVTEPEGAEWIPGRGFMRNVTGVLVARMKPRVIRDDSGTEIPYSAMLHTGYSYIGRGFIPR